MSNSTQINDRIQGRAVAAEVIAEYLSGESEAWQEGFLRECKRVASEKIPGASAPVMNDHQAEIFELEVMKFGKHAGQTIAEVPIQYLTWLVDAQIKLRAYLASARGQKRIEQEG
ncbi:MAG: DUF3820 family protein [bacterium]|nr:DUF3820 family protein [bacterium]